MARLPPARVLLIGDRKSLASTHRGWLGDLDDLDVVLTANDESAVAMLRARHYDAIVSYVSSQKNEPFPRSQLPPGVDLPILVVLDRAPANPPDGNAQCWLPQSASRRLLHKEVVRATQLRRLVAARRRTLQGLGLSDLPPGSPAHLRRRFDPTEGRLFLAHEPIIEWPARVPLGFEAFARSGSWGTGGAASPPDAARSLAVQRRLEHLASRSSQCLPGFGTGERPALLFLRLTPGELSIPELGRRKTRLRNLASQIVFGVSERAARPNLADLRAPIDRLRTLGYRFALDDVGTGQASLTSFANLDPDFVKLARCLVADVHREPTKRRLVGHLVRACRDSGVQVIAKDIRLAAERDTLAELGCALMQGPLFT